jgi:hypothetical protein
MLSVSEKKLKEFEDQCANLHIDVVLPDDSIYIIKGIDAKAFQVRCETLGMADFQLVPYVKEETKKYWLIKMLPTKVGNVSFEKYYKDGTYPQIPEKIEKMSDIFPVVLYHKFIRTPRLSLIMNALGGGDHLIVLGDGDLAMPNGKNIEAVIKKLDKKDDHPHLRDFQ